jgi:adenylate cyclase class 2
MNENTPTETEIKIPVPDLSSIRHRLESVGGRQTHPSLREVNILFDNADRTLDRQGRVLRLRRVGGRQIVTMKGPARFEGTIKHREELETDVGDIDLVSAILQRLGLQPVLRYEKDRESWQVDRVTVTLDHTPMGDFVELEGPAELLSDLATGIGADPAKGVRDSYVRLWQIYRQKHPELELPRDMVFPE